MSTATRESRSFSLEKTVIKEIERTRGKQSASERVNTLLKYGLDLEKKLALHQEAAAFYRRETAHIDNRGRQAFQQAAIASVTRDEE